MNRVPVNPELLSWARMRAGADVFDLQVRFPKLAEWESGELQPTLKQLEGFAKAVHAPIGYLFLPAPPEEPMPIPDFRTLGGHKVARPSPNLLDMIYACQERQSWYREYALLTQQPLLRFVGSATTAMASEDAAASMAKLLAFDLDARRDCRT